VCVCVFLCLFVRVCVFTRTHCIYDTQAQGGGTVFVYIYTLIMYIIHTGVGSRYGAAPMAPLPYETDEGDFGDPTLSTGLLLTHTHIHTHTHTHIHTQG
jgi:hypothetical protein